VFTVTDGTKSCRQSIEAGPAINKEHQQNPASTHHHSEPPRFAGSVWRPRCLAAPSSERFSHTHDRISSADAEKVAALVGLAEPLGMALHNAVAAIGQLGEDDHGKV
jgi:hypothetical protein